MRRIQVMLKKRGPYLRKTRPARAKTNFIREWREWAGLTQAQLAEASGLSGGSISAYELGTMDPSLEALKAISAALRVPMGMLLDVDPREDAPLWAGFLRATKDQRHEIGRIVAALVGPPKPRR